MSAGVPFGHFYNLEMEEIESELRAEGVTCETQLFFAARRRYEHRHKNDESYKSRSARWLQEQQRRNPVSPSINLTAPEIEYLIWRLEGSNEEHAISIRTKAIEAQTRNKCADSKA